MGVIMRIISFTKLTLLVLIVYAMTSSSSGADISQFPTHYSLWEGAATMHEVMVNRSCTSQINIVSPYEASFDLYALRNYGSPGACPSNLEVITNHNKVAISNRGRASLDLEEGLWCVVVYARSGNGSVVVTLNSNCPIPYSSPAISPYSKSATPL